MRRLIIAVVLLAAGTATASADPVTKFWNLTHNTIDSLELAPVGTTAFGPNLCLADPDKSVDPDERLKITGVKTGFYDARIHDTANRSCSAKNIHVTEGKIFSIEEKDLAGCAQ